MAEAPTRCCDLVMKGGISSGVVFPGDAPLLDLLATHHQPPTARFKIEIQRQEALAATRELLDLARRIAAGKSCQGQVDPRARPFCAGPRPRVELGSRQM